MEVPGSQNPVLQQVNQLWSMLDDMSLSSPESYRSFIEKQLREGKDACSPPQPESCIRVAILGPKQGVLYINVCSWKRIPAPSSPDQPVPVGGGRLETHTEGKEQYSVLDVAFSPEVLERARPDRQEREQLHLLAISFAQQQHGLRLSQRFSVLGANLKGSAQDMKDRLLLPRKPEPPAPPISAPTLLQQISSLRDDVEGGGDPAGGLTLQLGGGEQQQPSRPGLIQVISSSESPLPLPRRPPHQLTLQAGTGDHGTRRLELSVELPGVHSVAECQLSITQDDVLLEVEDMYHLQMDFPETVNEETATAIFNKRTHTLTITVSII